MGSSFFLSIGLAKMFVQVLQANLLANPIFVEETGLLVLYNFPVLNVAEAFSLVLGKMPLCPCCACQLQVHACTQRPMLPGEMARVHGGALCSDCSLFYSFPSFLLISFPEPTLFFL